MALTLPLMSTIAANSALIVDGLPLSMTSQELTELFSPFGNVSWARVVMDRFRRSLSYGYVVMEVDADDARAIEVLDKKPIAGGRKLRIAYCSVPPFAPRIAGFLPLSLAAEKTIPPK